MTSSEKRMLLPILRKLANHEKLNHRAQSAAEQLYARLTRPVSLKSKAGRLRREQQRATHKEETDAIYAAVEKRAQGYCENCLSYLWDEADSQMDHWLGGWGRRRQKQSVQTCWMLCADCHGRRTANRPDASYWNDRFRVHCERHGYPVLAHIEHQPLLAKAGGAP